MKNPHKKRVLLIAGSAATAGAVAALVVGATFGLFSATTPGQTNKFTAGKVSLTQSATAKCNIKTMVPGDGTATYPATHKYRTNTNDATCTFKVKYTGSVPADLGLNVTIDGDGLYNSTATGLQVKISSTVTTVVYMTGTTLGGSATTGNAPTATNLLVGADVPPNSTVTVTVNYQLPEGAKNGFQTKSTTVDLMLHAVQYANNGTPVAVQACTTGKACAAITAWS